MKNYVFNNDASIYLVNNLDALLDTFTLEEIEILYKTNLYYNELNIDMLELVDLGYLIDVNNVGYDKDEHIKTIKVIEKYVSDNFNSNLINLWEKNINYDWRNNKPKNLKKK